MNSDSEGLYEPDSATPAGLDELLEALEADTFEREWAHQRAAVFAQAESAYRARGDVEHANQARWRALAFSLGARVRHHRPSGEGRFSAFPDWAQDIPAEGLDALVDELNRTSNPIHRARYGDVLWERRRSYPAALAATEAYLDAIEVCVRSGWYHAAADAVDRASELSLLLHHQALMDRAKNAAFELAKNLIATATHPAVGWSIDVLSTLQGFDLAQEEHRTVISLIEAGASFYRTEHNPIFEQHFLSLLPETYRALKQPESALIARRRFAASFEAEAASAEAQSQYLRSIMIYQSAAQLYGDLGDAAKVDEIKRQLQRLVPLSQSQMKAVSTTITVPTEIADAWLNQLLAHDLLGALVILAARPPQIPSVARILEQSKSLREQFPLQHLVGRMVLDDRHILSSSDQGDESVDATTLRNYTIERMFGAWNLQRAFNELEATKGLNAAILAEVLKTSKILEPATLETVERGIERYFAEDYVSALHILVPQLEDALRSFLDRFSIARTSFDSGETREKTLDIVLKTPELRELLGEDFVTYLEMVLLRHESDNLRNRTAHGLLKTADCTRERTQEILSCYLALIKFGFLEEAGDAGTGE